MTVSLQIFDGSTLERADSRRDYAERRVIALGKAQSVALAVVYTDRAESNGEINQSTNHFGQEEQSP